MNCCRVHGKNHFTQPQEILHFDEPQLLDLSLQNSCSFAQFEKNIGLILFIISILGLVSVQTDPTSMGIAAPLFRNIAEITESCGALCNSTGFEVASVSSIVTSIIFLDGFFDLKQKESVLAKSVKSSFSALRPITTSFVVDLAAELPPSQPRLSEPSEISTLPPISTPKPCDNQTLPSPKLIAAPLITVQPPAIAVPLATQQSHPKKPPLPPAPPSQQRAVQAKMHFQANKK